MPHDVKELAAFYETRLGQVARRLIRRRLRAFWPNVSGMTVLGLGYATPYLRPFLDEAARVIAIMPATQGADFWPAERRGLTALAEETALPLPDESVDRVVLAHGLEMSEEIRPLLRELWRVLAPEGRIVALVPNRRGLWARFERTPFGFGQPYSQPQLRRLLADNLFEPTGWSTALHLPPFGNRLLVRTASAVEEAGSRWWPRFAGVLLVEAIKQVYGVKPIGTKRRAARRLATVLPVPAPRLREQEHALLG